MQWRSNWESCCTSWKTDAVPDNLVGVDDLLDDVSGQLSQLIEMAEGVHSDIEMLIELLQSASVSVGKCITVCMMCKLIVFFRWWF